MPRIKVEVGDNVRLVSIRNAGRWTSRGKRFVTCSETPRPVVLPVGTVLYFFNGFMVKMYGPDGAGVWGGPEREFFTVVLIKKKGRLCLKIPRGIEDRGGKKVAVGERFQYLAPLGEHVAKVIWLPPDQKK